jgi:hypothetical protein
LELSKLVEVPVLMTSSGQITGFSDAGAMVFKARAAPAEQMIAATIIAIIILGFIVPSPIK